MMITSLSWKCLTKEISPPSLLDKKKRFAPSLLHRFALICKTSCQGKQIDKITVFSYCRMCFHLYLRKCYMKKHDTFSQWIVASKIRTSIFMIIIGVIMMLFALLVVIRGQKVSGESIMLQNLGVALAAYAGHKLTRMFLDFKHIFWSSKLKNFLRLVFVSLSQPSLWFLFCAMKR